MHVVDFTADHISAAARLHAGAVCRARLAVPALDDRFEDPAATAALLAGIAGFAALVGDRLVGYLTWRAPLKRFRRTEHTAAYVPEWAHGVCDADPADAYGALYASATRRWHHLGCSVQAITVLDVDRAAIDAWCRLGFESLVVDAVAIPSGPGRFVPPARLARVADAPALAALDAQHVAHYALPPTSMVAPEPMDEADWRRFVMTGDGGAMVADIDGTLVGFLRFGDEHGGCALTGGHGAFVDGLYVRPDHRRAGIASLLLDATVAALRIAGIDRVTLDYETANTSAREFWARHATPVCRSLARGVTPPGR